MIFFDLNDFSSKPPARSIRIPADAPASAAASFNRKERIPELTSATARTGKRHAERHAVVYNATTVHSLRRRAGESIRPATNDEVPGMRPNRSSTRWATALFAVAAVIGCVVLGRALLTSRPTGRPTSSLGANPHVKPVSYNQGAAAQPEGRRRLDQLRPDRARRAARQDRPARFLDVLLHQLPPRPPRPGEARREIQE